MMHPPPPIGTQVLRYDSVGSTNEEAARLLERGEAAHGAVVVALEQTGGKGRLGRHWHTAPGLDLAASFILEPEGLQASGQFLLSQCAALAVLEVVANAVYGHAGKAFRTTIKWPNDLLIGNAKVAGILIANGVRGAQITSSIIGIGINVNSRAFPADVRATSLAAATGTPRPLDAVLWALCDTLQRYLELAADYPDAVAANYNKKLWGLRQAMSFTLDGKPLTAKPLGVDRNGHLRIKDEQGQEAAYDMDRLRFVR